MGQTDHVATFAVIRRDAIKNKKKKNNAGLIAGVVIAGVVVIVLIALAIVFRYVKIIVKVNFY